MSEARSASAGSVARLVAVVVAVVLLGQFLTAVPGAVADTAPSVPAAVGAYRDAGRALRDAEDAMRTAETDRDASRRAWQRASSQLDAADKRLERQRAKYAALSAEVYVRQGSADQRSDDSMIMALSGQRQLLQQARDDDDFAAGEERRLSVELADRQKTVDRAGGDHDRAKAEADATGSDLEAAMAADGVTDLPAVAYVAYLDGAALVGRSHPGCGLSAAVLAGVGRIESGHGQNRQSSVDQTGHVDPPLRGLRGDPTPDTDGGRIDGDTTIDVTLGPMQLYASDWAAHGTDGDGDGVASPQDIFDSSATMAEILCAPGTGLSTFAALDAALTAVLGDGQQATAALGTARRYAAAATLDMGVVPADPNAVLGEGDPQFDGAEGALARGDVSGMIDWAMTRLGTPYSQCLGPDVRPQDPVCPPGTNRFGVGFFDCSGFVSHAFRLIGIKVPQTTYAMAADPTFMATEVSDHIDLSVMRPGDVFLMEGHTGLYVGNGMIVHAIGRGLTYQPVPTWVANGTIAVLRPLALLPPAPPDLSGIALPDFAALQHS